MLEFTRSCPANEFERLYPGMLEAVRAHLSACASPTDDPEEFAREVRIAVNVQDEVLTVTGKLARSPVAPYLSEDPADRQDSGYRYTFEPWEPKR